MLLIGARVGKTMLAVGLARQAAETGYRTYFTTADDLTGRCHRAAIDGRWVIPSRIQRTDAFRQKVELVVINPSAPYASGIRSALPETLIAVDKWHLVALADQM